MPVISKIVEIGQLFDYDNIQNVTTSSKETVTSNISD